MLVYLILIEVTEVLLTQGYPDPPEGVPGEGEEVHIHLQTVLGHILSEVGLKADLLREVEVEGKEPLSPLGQNLRSENPALWKD